MENKPDHCTHPETLGDLDEGSPRQPIDHTYHRGDHEIGHGQGNEQIVGDGMKALLAYDGGNDENVARDGRENNGTENDSSDNAMFNRDENGGGGRRGDRLLAGGEKAFAGCLAHAENMRIERIAEDDRRGVQLSERAVDAREIVGEKAVHRIGRHHRRARRSIEGE